MVGEACRDFKSLAQGNYNVTCPGIEPTTLGFENHESSARTIWPRRPSNAYTILFSYTSYSRIYIPYYPGYKAMALFPVQGHPWPYNEYKAMAL